MINRITYSVEFPSTGATLKGDFKPQPGITAVVGPNEAGKTFSTIEMTRYLLFGKKALRGPASDYKKLDAKGEFTIRGHRYTIARSAKKETLTDATANVLAVGADEVTNKVTELLGYGLKVFDVANASVQKRADLFGTLPAGERKRMIDEVAGLIDQEKVEKALKTEAATLQREAEAMTRMLTPPVEPEKPADYLPSEKLKAEWDEERARTEEYQRVSRYAVEPTKPEKPDVRRPKAEEIAELEQKHRAYWTNEETRRQLQNDVLPFEVEPLSEEKLEAAAARLEIQRLTEGKITCPDCGSEFVPGHGHVDLPDGPDLTLSEIRAARRTRDDFERSERAKESLATLPVLPDVSELLANNKGAEAEWAEYDRQRGAYDVANERYLEAVAQLEKLDNALTSDELEYLHVRLVEAQIYEKQLASYDALKVDYDTKSAKVADYAKRAKEYKDGATYLSDARGSIKSYLAPAISAAASNLMHHMTKGKHSVVTVDDDMEIKVGEQTLDTLSGGAATVANLALRLALGQVLVGDSFPVFLGDEMDSDADEARRETVADALQSLVARDLLKQVILVTHRSIDIADHVHDVTVTE